MSKRSTIASIASHESWARTTDRAARTAPARAKQQEIYRQRAAELHPGGTEQQIAQAADHLYRADQKRRALKSVEARRAKREGGGRAA